MLDVRRLLVLRAVAQHGSLAAAARSLGYTQPAVSHQIRRLEQEAGVRLFARDGRGVRLTDAGRALAARAETIAAELGAAEAELAAAARDQAGHLRIAVLPSANAGLVPQALAELRARHPEIAVSLVEAGPGEAWSLLRRAECDLAVTFDHPILFKQPQADVAVVPLLDDLLLVILPAAHPLAGAKELTLDRLSDEAWILSTHCQAEMRLACTAAGFTPKVALVTEDYYRAVPRLVAGGLGVGFATAFLSRGARPPGVVMVPVAGLQGGRLIAVLPRRLHSSPALTFLLEALQAAVSRFGDAAVTPAHRSPPVPRPSLPSPG